MQIYPEFSAFADTYGAEGQGPSQVVWSTLVSDMETPVSAMLRLAQGQPNSFLLESVEGGANRGRYSFIGLRPDIIWRCFGDRAEINRTVPDDPRPLPPALFRKPPARLNRFVLWLGNRGLIYPTNCRRWRPV